MKVGRYIGGGKVVIADEPTPHCAPGGLLVKTTACGLCSGELMSWYMDQKIPHVLGHEVAGIVLESQDERFPVGTQVFPHHHAPCLNCDFCRDELYVHCAQWRRTKLVPGGMAEYFAVGAENLSDTVIVDDMRAIDAALIEPLACVMKSLRIGKEGGQPNDIAVIGLGFMGLMHMFMLGSNAIGYDIDPSRIAWAQEQGLRTEASGSDIKADLVIVCPGSQEAFDFGLSLARPGATVVMFAPLAPSKQLCLPQDIYFKDIRLAQSYSCGPDDTLAATRAIREGRVRAEQVVSDFIGIDQLPAAYEEMKARLILKPMVVF